VRWFRAHEWPAQAVLVLGAVAIAAVLFVFGLMVGTGIAPMVGGGQRPAHSLTNCRTWPRLDLLAGNRNMCRHPTLRIASLVPPHGAHRSGKCPRHVRLLGKP
jgi:hypothetical protein